MNKRDAARLRKERLAQIDRAVESRYYSDMPRSERDALFRERDRQTRMAQAEYTRNIATPTARKSAARVKSTSRFWRHFGRDGQPVPPWETEAGPQVDSYDDDDADDESMFADEDYTYEDFDTDWGGYEYSDTGYPDEDA